MSSRINKPKPSKFTNTASKSSDRRLAAGRQPAKFLHNVVAAQANNVSTSSNAHISTSNSSNSNSGNKSYNPPSSDTKTVKRSVGDKSWEDSSLLEWNPKHFRLFVGNLGPDANDELLASAFGKFKTMSKVKVPTDNKTGKNKGYGFVSFESPDDYFMAFKEINGKYIGQHPVQLKRAETNIKPVKKGRKGGR